MGEGVSDQFISQFLSTFLEGGCGGSSYITLTAVHALGETAASEDNPMCGETPTHNLQRKDLSIYLYKDGHTS